jgi:hypothetical protein
MTYRDQLEFKIRKLTRAIDALADLPDFSEVTKLAEKLNRERGRLRRTIADGRRSCGECGNPMRHETMHTADDVTTARLARMGASEYHVCEDHCSEFGKMIFE